MTEPIQRWGLGSNSQIFSVYGAEGEWVRYDDHLAAMTKDNSFDAARVAYDAGYGRGLDAAREAVLDAAVQRVEAIADDHDSGVAWNWDYDIDPTGMTRNPRVWIREAVAAIRNEVK